MVLKVPFPLSNSGVPGGSASNPFWRNASPVNLKKWRQALSAQQAGVADAQIAFIGDSTTVGLTNLVDGTRGHFRRTSYPVRFAECFSAFMDDVDAASVFTVPTGRTNGINVDYDERLSLNAWKLNGPNNVDAVYDYGTIFGRMFFNDVDTSLLSLVVATQFDTVDIYYLRGTSFGAFDVKVNGVNAGSTINTSGVDGFAKSTVSLALTPTASNTVAIAKTSAAEVRIAKIVCRRSDQKRILINSGGISGGKVADYNLTVPAFSPARPQARARLAEASVFENHLYVVSMTINDSTNPATPVVDYKANLRNILQSLSSHASVILVTGFPHKRSSATPADLAPYYQANYELSDELALPMLDMAGRWVSYTDAEALMFYARELGASESDNAHPSPQGYADAGRALSQFIFGVE